VGRYGILRRLESSSGFDRPVPLGGITDAPIADVHPLRLVRPLSSDFDSNGVRNEREETNAVGVC
jgi:hypothetical protein